MFVYIKKKRGWRDKNQFLSWNFLVAWHCYRMHCCGLEVYASENKPHHLKRGGFWKEEKSAFCTLHMQNVRYTTMVQTADCREERNLLFVFALHVRGAWILEHANAP